MSKSIAYKHYLRALSHWPKDSLRPECQFQDVIRRRVDRRFLPASSSNAPNAAQATANSAIDEKAELVQVNAIYSLLENRYSGKYPIKGTFLKPASNPTHYTDLVKELEEAPDRSWWSLQVNKWKGFLRFQ
ncbi:hypothetical protein NA56DRAFT_636842 [Hyaloscypha hepaticicola]|uniref:Ubiquinol-cytochrome-c reductase complex assembly factor 2 n=1 Tax=Hyaloscypha hepaticicola TaxID=2082293 RepID=A0A2J6PJ40_9HELO|nr:hypothetical protein NA56DRAFT_636842 [Hyaloscypha hepaticicola]